MPDRLPSLIVLAGFWIPPAVAGWVAGSRRKNNNRDTDRDRVTQMFLGILIVGYAALWFLFNLGRMPPYIPGSTIDPTFASPEAVRWLAIVTCVLVLPGSALACVLAFRSRVRMLRDVSS